MQCIGLDRGSEAELPRSLVSYLEGLVAQLELKKEDDLQTGTGSTATLPVVHSTLPPLPSEVTRIALLDETAAAYNLAATIAENSAPVASLNIISEISLPYYRVFFMGAELPFPLAFQEERPIWFPGDYGNVPSTRLPEEVADKLVAIYVEFILPQYPLFLKQDVIDMYQRFKTSNGGFEISAENERFTISMIMAIATLSSGAKDYRKVVTVAESLRHNAIESIGFGQSSNDATAITLTKLLLLAQYGYLLPSTTNLWQVVGDAARIALALGLHQETPPESGLDDAAVDSRKRLFWTLYAIERSVAITSHRPYAIAEDQIHIAFPLSHGDSNHVDETTSQVPHIRFIDRLRFLRLQSEICSVNIGLRAIPDPLLTHAEWMVDVEARISEATTQAATHRWCAFMKWQSILLLHMPCARNPNPEESSVLKCFDAAVQIAHGYWELIEADHLNYPWHATHHCYEAGILILYSLWHFRDLLGIHYTTNQVFEASHRISGFFILVVKQWPAAQKCGMLFDRLRMGALSFFREGSIDPESSIEAKQLKELLFRKNADLLYAREQWLPTTETPDQMEELDIDLDLAPHLDFHDFLDFSRIPDFDGFTPVAVEDGVEQPNLPDSPVATLSSSYAKPTSTAINMAQLRAAMQKLPVCSHCKRRRVKCDMTLPACRNCVKLHQDCSYWDNALSQETPRKHIHALHQYIEGLIKETNEPCQAFESVAASSIPATDPTSPDLGGLGTVAAMHLQSKVLTSILCRPSSNAASSPDLAFFGVPNAFTRLATVVDKYIPLPKEVGLSATQPTRLPETIYGSLNIHIIADLPRKDARSLAWLYYRSIEWTYPILGQDQIHQVLNCFYGGGSSRTGPAKPTFIRYSLIIAIAFALLSVQDRQLQIIADNYVTNAIADGVSEDLFLRPTNESLQFMLLLSIYAWIRPGALNVWRILGHASRMCLDIIEMHGSDKTDSTETSVLYRTLYTLETQICISSGRPHQLPDGQDVLLPSTEDSMIASRHSTMVYSLARLQYRLYKDVVSRDCVFPGQNAASAAAQSASWMASCIDDIKVWLQDWKNTTEADFSMDIPVPVHSGGGSGVNLKLPLKLWGEFQQCEALLLAKIAAEHRGQVLISSEEELAICKQLLQAADGLLHLPSPPADGLFRPPSPPPAGLSSRRVPDFVFPLTWTHAHSIFTAMTVLLQHMHNTGPGLDVELQPLFRAGLDSLVSFERDNNNGANGLVDCLRNLYNSSQQSTIV